MQEAYQILKRLLRTEKGSVETERSNKYYFDVARGANRHDVKRAVEKIYNVKVSKVNTMVVPGKAKTVRRESGYTPDWKKAIVTLAAGQKIDLTT